MHVVLNMVMFHVGDGPNVSRVLSQGIAGILRRLFALEVFSPRVLVKNPDCVTLATLVHDEHVQEHGKILTMRYGLNSRKAVCRPLSDCDLGEDVAYTSGHLLNA